MPLPAQTVAPVSSTLAGPPACSTASQVSPPSATPVATAVGLNALPREPAPAVEDEDEEVVQVGAAGTGAVVDMEVFGQLLEIVSDPPPALLLDPLTNVLSLSPCPPPPSPQPAPPALPPVPPPAPLFHLAQDDDESHEFSKTLAFDYISQADTTFSEIEEALYVSPTLHLPSRNAGNTDKVAHFAFIGSSRTIGPE